MRGIVEFRVDRSHTLGEGSEGARSVVSLGTKQLMTRLRELLITFLLYSHHFSTLEALRSSEEINEGSGMRHVSGK